MRHWRDFMAGLQGHPIMPLCSVRLNESVERNGDRGKLFQLEIAGMPVGGRKGGTHYTPRGLISKLKVHLSHPDAAGARNPVLWSVSPTDLAKVDVIPADTAEQALLLWAA